MIRFAAATPESWHLGLIAVRHALMQIISEEVLEKLGRERGGGGGGGGEKKRDPRRWVEEGGGWVHLTLHCSRPE